ncbi:MAG: glycosyltransferase, partial [Nitrososphaerales archaeon]
MKQLLVAFVGLYTVFALVGGIWRGRRAAQRASRSSSPGPQRWPFVSVIIPAWRDRAALQTCLRSLAKVDYPDYEVIVVAGGPDGTYDTACAMAGQNRRMHVIEQLPRGKNAALNQGLAVASADTIVFLDADSELSPQWLKGLVGPLQGDVAAVTGNYSPIRETPVALWGDLAKVHEYLVRDRVILQGSGGIAVRREALEAIGPFPEERISSDWDLDARLALQGYTRKFALDAAIRSHRPATLREWWQNELRWRRLHLRSLFRLKAGLLATPGPTARHLYPYIASWTVALSTVIAAGAPLTRWSTLKQAALLAWGGLTSLLLMRDLIPVVTVLVYQPSKRWLPLIPLAPVMTVMTWAACFVASLTAKRASLQFKGVR